MKQVIHIPRTLANRLLTLAQGSPNSDVCGLIAHNSQQQYSIYPMANHSDNYLCAFECEPKTQAIAIQQINEKQQSLFAIFHSHSARSAKPKPLDHTPATDLLDAATENTLSIIISLSTQGVLEICGFSNKNNKTETVDLVIH